MPREEAPSPAPERSADRAWAAWSNQGSWLDLRRSISIPMSGVLFVLAGALVVVVITWVWAYSAGKGRAESQVRKELGLNTDIHEPDSIPVNSNLMGSPKAPEARPLPPAPQPEKKPKVKDETPAFVAGADPRVVGLNYYLLAAGLDKDAALKAVDFLNENGLPSAAVVDRKPRASNNGPTYVVFVLKGLTPAEYKAQNAPPRSEIDTLVLKLARASKEKKGQPDISQGFWQKFAG